MYTRHLTHLVALVALSSLGCAVAVDRSSGDEQSGVTAGAMEGGCRWICPKPRRRSA